MTKRKKNKTIGYVKSFLILFKCIYMNDTSIFDVTPLFLQQKKPYSIIQILVELPETIVCDKI